MADLPGGTAFVADPHIANHRLCGGPLRGGINDRCTFALTALYRAVGRACALQADRLVVLGDLFDTPRPTPQLVRAVGAGLSGRVDHPHTIVITGNHEYVSSAPFDHGLASLVLSSGITVLADSDPKFLPGQRMGLVLVPFSPPGESPARDLDLVLDHVHGPASRPWDTQHGPRVLGLHMGISDHAILKGAPWLAGGNSIDVDELATIAQRHGLTHVLSGDWHEHRRWLKHGVEVIQVGALVPTGWDNEGIDAYGKLVYVDPEGDVSVHDIPGPRFITITAPEQLDAYEDAIDQHAVYVRARVPAALANDVRAYLDEFATQSDEAATIAGYRIEIVSDGAAQVQDAAREARAEMGVDEALSSFVQEMPLDAGVDRDRVLALSREYLVRVNGGDR